MKYSVVTFGCRVNQADSHVLEAQLQAHGLTESAPDDADVVVVNTCSVTASADQGARQLIRRIGRRNPTARVVATGCYATRRPEEVGRLPQVVQVVANDEKLRALDSFLDGVGLTTAERYSHGDDACGLVLAPGVTGRTALTLRVQTGCDADCSYCIIPATRGASRSRALPDVVRDIEGAVAAGYREVTITGVHLGSYGRDLERPTSLSHLVEVLAAWDADVLFRLSSLEPMDCTDEIVDRVASSRRLAPHFHLPLQHGSGDMLRTMRRPYLPADYCELTTRIRRILPDASIGSDVIVGFPGETERHFSEMCDLLERLPLTYLHVFPYSDRPGTPAAGMPQKVDGGTIRERGRQVRAIGARMTAAFRHSQAGRERRALTVDDGTWAVTDNYLKVRLEVQHPRNVWVRARL